MLRTAQATDYWTPTPADFPRVPAVAAHYWESVADPHRGWMLQAVAALGGAASLLEIGCQSGPNLRILRNYYPNMRLMGLDVNELALQTGRRLFEDEGLTGVDLRVGTVPGALAAVPDDAFDIVLSVYTLAYQNPEDIVQTLGECLRVARRALILIEPTPAGDQEEQHTVAGSDYVEWRYDYVRLLEGVPGSSLPLRVARIQKPPYRDLTEAVIVVKTEADGQPVR